MKKMIKSALLALACMSSPWVAAEGLKSQLDVFVVLKEQKQGKPVETLVKSEDVEPGTLMEYVATYTNEGDSALSGFNIKIPVPDNTIYIGDSASSDVKAVFTVSVDDGKTFEKPPVMREVIKDGKKEKVEIPPSEYDVVAWRVAEKLKPSKAMSMRYRVIVQ